jgi:hypothetical protein
MKKQAKTEAKTKPEAMASTKNKAARATWGEADDDAALMVTLLRLSAWTGLSRPRLSQLSGQGVLPRGVAGRYPLQQSVLSYIKFLQQERINRPSAAKDAHLEERTLLVREQRKAAEFEAAIKAKKFCPIEETTHIVSEEYGRTCENLRSLPGTVAPMCEGLPSEAIRVIIAERVNEILAILSAPEDVAELTAAKAAAGEA